MNLMGRAEGGPGGPPAASGPSSALAGLAGQSHLLNWADKTFGQGLTSLTKGEPAPNLAQRPAVRLSWHLRRALGACDPLLALRRF